MIIDEAAYLEHFGIKGMHWGVRKTSDSGDTPKKMSTRAKVITGSAAALVVGSLATSIILHNVNQTKITKLMQEHITFVSAKSNLDRKMNARMSELMDLAKMTQPGHPSHEGAKHEITNLVDFYQTKLKKLADKNGVDEKTFAKMKLKMAI